MSRSAFCAHDRRNAEIEQLQRESKMIVEVRGIEDDQQSVWAALAFLFAEENVARDRLVGARGIEAVGAGELDQLGGPAVAKHEAARLTLDRHAGIIADFLTATG